MQGLLFNIKSEGTQGRVDIIGNISEWNQNNAIDFRERCQAIKDAGATSCHVYLMTNGGDCFQANEIYNILNELFGEYTGEGGAIVASAGTYLAVKAKTFEMAKNGQFMVHKPSGYTGGNETEVENYLKLLKNMTTIYYDTYKLKLKKPESEFKTKWDGGDFWMTAQEAKEWGFVTSVKEPVKVTKALAAEIKASGSPLDFSDEDIISNQNNENKMNLQAIALTLGLAANATEADITAKIAENAQKAKDYDALVAATAEKEKTEKAEKIKAALDKAEKEHRITADTRANWQNMLEANYDITIKVLEASHVVTPLSAEILIVGENGTKTYNGKTYEQLEAENPALLAELAETKPEVFDALFAEYKKSKNLK
ncbi:MAG: Clp protease ClpP [Paludibacter sp.]|nr:Clp protease ClpP [Paludibacter sp.]